MKELKTLLQKVKNIHFIGIGGANMSALALFFYNKGYVISGSDNNNITSLFKNQDITIYKGHKHENIGNADMIVYTRAVSPDNPELTAAKEKGIPVFERAEILGAVSDMFKFSFAVAGTHGKTTTTSMLATVLLDSKKDPTIMVGGKMQKIDSNLFIGKSDYFVYEACEYYDAFLHFFPFVSIILNIEKDHPDYFKSIEQLVESFGKFANNTKNGGRIIANGDDENVKKLIANNIINKNNLITFGLNENCDFYAENIVLGEDYTKFEVYKNKEFYDNIELSVMGKHNVMNALGVIAAADFIKIDKKSIHETLKEFTCPKRRYELVFKKDNLTVIDDFAHHPTELKTTLTTARNSGYDNVVAIFQPHTYTRTKALLNDFADVLKIADKVILLPIFPAREEDIYNISSKDLAEKIENSILAKSIEDAAILAKKEIKNKTVILTIGAGDVYKVWEFLK